MISFDELKKGIKVAQAAHHFPDPGHIGYLGSMYEKNSLIASHGHHQILSLHAIPMPSDYVINSKYTQILRPCRLAGVMSNHEFNNFLNFVIHQLSN